jgi:D-serine deaminase-like pyridoxal phosphate-dependent protein
VLDAGSKALAADPGPDRSCGLVLEAPSSRVARLSEEHAVVELATSDELELGQRVRIVPNHACAAVNLQDTLWLERGGEPVGRWPVAARGR